MTQLPRHADPAGKPSPIKRWLTPVNLGAVAVTVVLVGVAMWRFQAADAEAATDQPSRATGRVMPVRASTLVCELSYTTSRSYSGRIEARRTSELSFQQPGLLNGVSVTEGQVVELGQALAQLDTRRLEAMRARLVADKAAATAALDELLAGSRAEDIAQAQAVVAQFEANVARERLKSERLVKMNAASVANKDEMEEASWRTKAAEAELEAAKASLAEYEGGARKERIAAQRAAIDALSAQIELAEVEITDATIRAPYAGVIDRRMIDEGATVAIGQPVIRIVEQNHLEAWIGLPADAAASVETGQRVQVTIAGVDHPAIVQAILPQVDGPTRTVTVIAAVEAFADETIRPGQVARLKMERDVKAEGYWMPTSALAKSERGLWAVYLLDYADGIAMPGAPLVASRADVEVLHTDGQRAFVRGAIREGQQIITAGVGRIAPGQPVRVVDDTDTNAPGDDLTANSSTRDSATEPRTTTSID